MQYIKMIESQYSLELCRDFCYFLPLERAKKIFIKFCLGYHTHMKVHSFRHLNATVAYIVMA